MLIEGSNILLKLKKSNRCYKEQIQDALPEFRLKKQTNKKQRNNDKRENGAPREKKIKI